ncbi:MAG TPA: TonB-dependent receptor, partial [Bacteroidetes bacterium]|nr:TonB-dependent receptor [Bacteroidota bacterium]
MKQPGKLLIIVVLLTVAGPSHLFAQTGEVTGTVIDRVTLEPLPSASVLVVGTTLGASTDIEGRFVIRDVPYGTYELRVTLVGYGPIIVSDVVLSAAKPVSLEISLDQSAISLETVDATATYFRRTPDAVTSSQRLSYEEIRRSPGGFEDVLRGISVFPGVAQAQSGRNDLVVRGGAPSENLYVVDNVEIPNINHFATQGSGGGPLSYVNLDFVSETAFATGGFGARCGDRMSSVLEIDLRNGRTDALGGKATIAATQFGLDLEGPAGNNGSFILSARRSYLDFIFKAAGFSFVPEYWDFLGRLSLSLDKTNTLTFLGVGALDNVDVNNNTADNRYDNSQVLVSGTNQYASGISWRHLFSNGFITTTLGRTFTAFDQMQRDSLLTPIFLNETKEGETSLRTDYIAKLGSLLELSAGVQVKSVRLKGGLILPPFGTPFGDTLSAASLDMQTRGTKTNAYAQLHGHLLPELQYTVGGRVDYFDLIESGPVFAPRGSLSYGLSSLTTINASAGMYHQAPALLWIT